MINLFLEIAYIFKRVLTYLFTHSSVIYSVGFFSAQEAKHLHFIINEADFPVSCTWKSLKYVLIFFNLPNFPF